MATSIKNFLGRAGKVALAAVTPDPLASALARAQAACQADADAATAQADAARRDIADLEQRAAALRELHQRLAVRAGQPADGAALAAAQSRRDAAMADYASAVAASDGAAETTAGAALQAAEAALHQQQALWQGEEQQRQAVQEAAEERRELLAAIEQQVDIRRREIASAEIEVAQARHDEALNTFVASVLPHMRALLLKHPQHMHGVRLTYFAARRCLHEGLDGFPDGQNIRTFDVPAARRLADMLLPAEPQDQQAA